MLENNTNKEFFNFEYNNFYFEPRNVEKSTIFKNVPKLPVELYAVKWRVSALPNSSYSIDDLLNEIAHDDMFKVHLALSAPNMCALSIRPELVVNENGTNVYVYTLLLDTIDYSKYLESNYKTYTTSDFDIEGEVPIGTTMISKTFMDVLKGESKETGCPLIMINEGDFHWKCRFSNAKRFYSPYYPCGSIYSAHVVYLLNKKDYLNLMHINPKAFLIGEAFGICTLIYRLIDAVKKNLFVSNGNNNIVFGVSNADSLDHGRTPISFEFDIVFWGSGFNAFECPIKGSHFSTTVLYMDPNPYGDFSADEAKLNYIMKSSCNGGGVSIPIRLTEYRRRDLCLSDSYSVIEANPVLRRLSLTKDDKKKYDALFNIGTAAVELSKTIRFKTIGKVPLGKNGSLEIFYPSFFSRINDTEISAVGIIEYPYGDLEKQVHVKELAVQYLDLHKRYVKYTWIVLGEFSTATGSKTMSSKTMIGAIYRDVWKQKFNEVTIDEKGVTPFCKQF